MYSVDEEQAGSNQQAGILLSVLGCMLISAAANYLNHFYSTLEKRTKIWSDNATLVTVWLVYLGGSFCAGYSVTFMNLILATSTPSVLFIFNIIFRYLLEGDWPNVKALCGIAMITIGIVTIGFSTSKVEKLKYIEEMREHLIDAKYMSYTVTSFSLAIISIFFNEYYPIYNSSSQDTSLVDNAVSTNTAAPERDPYNPEPIAYGFSSAMIGGQRKIFLAGVFLLFPEKLYQPEPEFIIFLLIALFTAAFWFYRVGQMISLFDGRFIIPFYQSSGILAEIFTACIFHKYFEKAAVPELIGFFLGSILVFSGICLISTSTPQSDNHRISNRLSSI